MNVSKTLGFTSVDVSGQTNAEDIAMLSEFLSNGVFSRFKGKIGDEDGVAGRAQVVSEGLGPILTLGRRRFGLGEVDIDGAAVDLGFVHSLLRLDTIGAVDEFDIAITTAVSVSTQIMITEANLPFGAAGITVSNDSNCR